uniref:Aminotransferase class I/classII large domain-containing protein n=1 Tax=Fibrocapsa japonica TaxID=94617 RepID=A0A7S2XZX4_9STRA|eukprot:CAMPEP_0113944592 /NCGR_PEP_ID=MMETSP1339-20121228/34743_1 /TAXON_ID=94617 /ORGANISM="Fibrocapsa japonica" /LENGTH=485 /DNA_ID=CAMNT_0000949845 /DNA_START=69 /DNA_END=1526 /DNA_ORIENTATION=+ /assembly_acc=CAM_ASM_000762
MSGSGKSLTIDTIAPMVRDLQYAVRGELYLAGQARMKAGKRVIFCNTGNPHAIGQQPLTFIRQVMALITAPKDFIENPAISQFFPPDAIARAKEYIAAVPGGVGAYSDSKGLDIVRNEIADFIARRDGYSTNPENIFLTNGASEGVRLCLRTIIRGPSDGIMVPIPQYPLYSASIGLYEGSLVGYYLDEKKGWAVNLDAMYSALNKARSQGITVRALVFINPGNPTGKCLTQQGVSELVRFCVEENIVLMADEVYQENIYESSAVFISARKTMMDMGSPYSEKLELISFHTVSKGVYGECGLRGGYFELTNIDPEVAGMLYKIASINLSPNVPGQIALGLMVNPPQPGSPSYDLLQEEKAALLQSLKNRAQMMSEAFNSLPGISCEQVDSSLYAFPQITLPQKALEAAAAAGKSPDVFYCLELLNETGISGVPGSGFGQEEGTFHFRTTILPPEDEFEEVVQMFKDFHSKFMAQYSDGEQPMARL